jgi:hypothetical protein
MLEGPAYTAFLASLKVGDKVAVKNRPVGNPLRREYGWRIYTIAHITPKRRFDVVRGGHPTILFSADGDIKQTRNSGGPFCRLEPATSEVLDGIISDNRLVKALNAASKLENILRDLQREDSRVLGEVDVYTSLTALLERLTFWVRRKPTPMGWDRRLQLS